MERYRVGDIVVDPDTAVVSRAGQPIPLPPLTFNLLLALVRRAPHLARREELLADVWPGEFVSDETLSQRVRLLRRALGDTSDNPRYVASVRGWGYRLVAPVAASPAAVEPVRALAVLPLANLAGDAEQDYLADGLTDALITSLSKFRTLRIISRTSVMRYRRTDKPVQEIAHELSVQALVEGSVLRSGRRLWITAQLVRAAADEHIWSESYERDMGDVPALLDEMAGTIARAIHVAISLGDHTRPAAGRRVDPDAYESFLRALYYMRKYAPPDVDRGVALLEDAVARQPEFAEGHVALARAYVIRAEPFGADLTAADSRRMMSKSKAAAERALQLDGSLASAYAALASATLFCDWDWRRAVELLERAIELDPNCSDAHLHRALVGACLLERDVVQREGQRAVELDPFNLGRRAQIAECCYWVRDHEGAIRRAQDVLSLDRDHARAHFVLGRVYEAQGRIPRAIRHYQRALMLTETSAGAARRAFTRAGAEGFHQWALKAGLGGQTRPAAGTTLDKAVRPVWTAKLHCQAGNLETALEYLEQAYAERDGLLMTLNVDVWDPLRGHPRFRDLVRRVGLPWIGHIESRTVPVSSPGR